MDFDATPAVVIGPDYRLDVFARAPDGSLQHWWGDVGSWETENLGGSLSAAPAVTMLEDGRLRVFAVTDAGTLGQWIGVAGRWESSELGGSVTGRPAIGTGTVFARGADGSLQVWRSEGDGWVGPEGAGGVLASDPVQVQGAAAARGMYRPLLYWPDPGGMTASPMEPVEHHPPYVLTAAHPPAAAWYRNRLDVFFCQHGGSLYKYSWDGGRWWRDDLGGEVTLAPAAVSSRPDKVDVFARSAAGTLLRWSWDATGEPDGLMSDPWGFAWVGPDDERGALASAPAVVARDDDLIDVFCRGTDGALLHWQQGWQQPLPQAPRPAAPPPEPQLLVVRPDDLVVLGVRHRGMNPVEDDPFALVATEDDARLILTFPPQHVAEDTLPSGTELASFRARARLAGPSRLVFAVAPEERVVLTTEGVLAAMNQGRIVPAADEPAGPDETAIELPWRLRFSPESRSPDGYVACDHPTSPVAPESGTVGLWHTRLHDGTPGQDAGLVLPPVDPGLAATPDGALSPPLSRAGRSSVVRYGLATPPAAERLELSTLGGSLSAQGDWDRFRWEHETSLGRDHRVEARWQGVLYPLGHQAVYEETTERVFATADGTGSVAALRKRRTLTCLEPVRGAPDDQRLRRAFPFHRVEITRTVLELPGKPDWTFHPTPRPPVAGSLQARRLAYLDRECGQAMGRALEALHGTGDPAAEGPIQELQVRVTLMFGALPPGGRMARDLAPWRDRLPAVDRFVELLLERERVRNERLDPVPLPLFFARSLPEEAGADPVDLELPVRATGASGDVRFTLSLIFVADHRLEAHGDLPAYHTLTDPEVQHLVVLEYGDRGEVPLPAVTIDLVGSPDRREADRHEVHRIRIEGPGADDTDPWPASGEVRPMLTRIDAELPALRTLVEHSGPVSLAFTDSYLNHGEREEITLALAEPLQVPFTKHADRCGALLAPDFEAGAISRLHGPVNPAGARSLDPADLFEGGATLLGFELRSIVHRAKLTAPPTIVSTSVTGQPAAARMRWQDVALTDHGSFLASNGEHAAQLDLEVTVGDSPEQTVTRCTVDNFTLVMPLLKLRFGRVTFIQRPGQHPRLEVAGVDAEFDGKLRLLQKLASAVGLGNATPDIDVRPDGITARYRLPVLEDVPTGAFTLRNLVFHAAIDVPFQPEPDRPITVTLAFASREEPFGLSVLMFGGGGYIMVTLDHAGVRELEVALEFGAFAAVNFGVVSAEVYAVGGVRIALEDGGPEVSGYIRFGGSVQLFGLVSVAIDMRVELTYDDGKNELYGRATLVLEVDVTLFSERVELDSGPWRIAGNDPDPRHALERGGAEPVTDLDEENWRRYRENFVEQEAVR